MKIRKSLAITLQQKVPTLLLIGDQVIEIYFNQAKGATKAEVCFVAEEEVKIIGPHIILKNKELYENKYPDLFKNDRIWKKGELK